MSILSFSSCVGVRGVLGVCVHRNRSYAEGEVFVDGCELRCVCREGGLLECRDRCEVFIDTVGFEGCEWLPSEEDPCCVVPVCRRKIPPLMPGLPDFAGERRGHRTLFSFVRVLLFHPAPHHLEFGRSLQLCSACACLGEEEI